MPSKRNSKRPHGSGSVRQKGSSWQGRWRHNGEPVQETLGKVKSADHPDGLTSKQANEALAKAMAVYQPPNPMEAISFEEICDRFIVHIESLNRKKSTVQDYKSCIRVHLKPEFEGKPIKAITEDQIEKFQAKKLKVAAPKSVLNWMSILHGVLAYALEKGFVETNFVSGVTRPEVEAETELRFLTLTQLDALLAACPNTKMGKLDRMLYLLAARTGLRQGELIALCWKHIDFEAKRIRVQQNFVRGEHTSPKSKKGRSVPMASTVDRELKEFFKQTRFNRDNDLVFAHPETGTELERSRLLKRFKANIKKAGVGEFEERTRKSGNVETVALTKFHDLRHTFGTLCAAGNAPLRSIMEWMGHADLATTLIYAHYAPGDDDAALIEAAFTPKAPATNRPQTPGYVGIQVDTDGHEGTRSDP